MAVKVSRISPSKRSNSKSSNHSDNPHRWCWNGSKLRGKLAKAFFLSLFFFFLPIFFVMVIFIVISAYSDVSHDKISRLSSSSDHSSHLQSHHNSRLLNHHNLSNHSSRKSRSFRQTKKNEGGLKI